MNNYDGIFIGWVIGVLMAGACIAFGLQDILDRGEESSMLLIECQKELPRDQFCEIIAKPIKK